jgi:hypothetical protein
LDFDLFLKRKNGGLSQRSIDHARVAGPWVHRGPHSGRRPEFTEARPSGRFGARWLAVEARKARGRRGDPSGGLTSGGGAVRRDSGGGERSLVATLSVRGAQGEEERGAFYRAGQAVGRRGGGRRWWSFNPRQFRRS